MDGPKAIWLQNLVSLSAIGLFANLEASTPNYQSVPVLRVILTLIFNVLWQPGWTWACQLTAPPGAPEKMLPMSRQTHHCSLVSLLGDGFPDCLTANIVGSHSSGWGRVWWQLGGFWGARKGTRVGGGREVQEGGDMCTYGWFMLMMWWQKSS